MWADPRGRKRIGVLGGGIMGTGIAEICARSGFEVTLVVDDSRAQAAHARVSHSLDRAVRRGKLESEAAREVWSAFRPRRRSRR